MNLTRQLGATPYGFATFADPNSNFRGTIASGPGGVQFNFGNTPPPQPFPWLWVLIAAAIVVAISEG